jgi:hypothetical protein
MRKLLLYEIGCTCEVFCVLSTHFDLLMLALFTLLSQVVDNDGTPMNCLDLACASECNDFISHAACRNVIQEEWFGALSPETSWISILLTIFPGLSIPAGFKSLFKLAPLPSGQNSGKTTETPLAFWRSNQRLFCKSPIVQVSFAASAWSCALI